MKVAAESRDYDDEVLMMTKLMKQSEEICLTGKALSSKVTLMRTARRKQFQLP